MCVLIAVLYFAHIKPPDNPISPSAPGPSPVATRPGTTEPARPPQTLINSLGMEFVLIPAGEFSMRSANGANDARPVHTVRISREFYLGKYEVTQGQWEAVMGTNPSQFKGESKQPVEQVSWEDAQEFIRKLNVKEGGDKVSPADGSGVGVCSPC
jgi:formylglycine-generating enzyme required for sulfatase activity